LGNHESAACHASRAAAIRRLPSPGRHLPPWELAKHFRNAATPFCCPPYSMTAHLTKPPASSGSGTGAPPAYKSKTLATWVAFFGGPVGLHRFYLHGFADVWGWLLPLPTMLGAWGLRRVGELGQDDQLAWLLIPILGFTVAATMLQAILYGLTPDETWHARHNAALSASLKAADPTRELPSSGWAAVIGVGLSLMVGATVLMSTIAFSGQRYFEYQVEESRRISQ
jgi:hypothetical protein